MKYHDVFRYSLEQSDCQIARLLSHDVQPSDDGHTSIFLQFDVILHVLYK